MTTVSGVSGEISEDSAKPTLMLLDGGRVARSVDLKVMPYRDGKGSISERAIRALLTGREDGPLLPRPTIRVVK